MTTTCARVDYRPAPPKTCPTDRISQAAVCCLMARNTSRELAEYAVANLSDEGRRRLAKIHVDEQFAALGF